METPQKQVKSNSVFTGVFATPLKIPATPQLKRLGLGTGIEVMLLKRSPRVGTRSPWAIKRLNKRVKGQQMQLFEERIVYEAEILKQLKHPNIVGFRNLIKDKTGHNCLAMENGEKSLGDILEERLELEQGPLPYQTLRKMALDVALALKYLHTEAMILHGDLKSFNVLVKDNTFKLCDFGVSVPINKDGFIDNEKYPDLTYTGTDCWSAPEVLEGDMELVSTKSEMFSFGLLIYEGIALVPPHTLEVPQENKENAALVISIKDSDDEEDDCSESLFSSNFGTRPPLPEQLLSPEYDNIIGLFFICTNAEQDSRPSASEAVKYIQSLN